jgi:site-specific recombinase XerD
MSTLSITQSSPITDSPNLTHEQRSRIDTLLHNSKAQNTLAAYNSDWSHFASFCTLNALTCLPAHPDTILLYLSELSQTHSFSTIKRRLTSINKAHLSADFPSPTNVQSVKELLNGIARTIGNKQQPKKALVLDDLKLLIDAIDVSTLTGKRDKALILIGFSTASRRSELVSINVNDITFTNEGIDISIHEEKTQNDINKSILYAHNEYCPIEALMDWLNHSNIKVNAIFRSINKSNRVGERLNDKSVVLIVKKYALLAGLDPSLYAGHSLRSGFATSAAEEGYSAQAIMHQTGHKTEAMVNRYVQQGNRYKNNASSILSTL